jgi:hypothetical protein
LPFSSHFFDQQVWDIEAHLADRRVLCRRHACRWAVRGLLWRLFVISFVVL